MRAGRITVDITSATIFRVVLILVGVWFLYTILNILLILFSAIIIASAIEPVARRLKKYRVPRAVSVILVYVIVLLVLSSAVTLMIPPLTDQVAQIAQALPTIVDQLQRWGVILPGSEFALISSLQDLLFRVGENLAGLSADIFQRTKSFFSGAFTLLFVFILAFYMVAEEGSLKKLFRFVVPRAHLAYVEQAVERAQRRIGRWVLAQLGLGLIIGIIVGVGLWLLGVPYALSLGLLAGVMEIIPVIGPIIAAVPGVAVGLTQGIFFGLLVLGFYILVQQLENHLLVPNIMRRAVGLNPLVTLLAVLLGGQLAGIVGIILAVPVATVLSVILTDLFARPDDEMAG